MADEAVNGTLNQGMQAERERERVRQMVPTIDPKPAHTLPLTNGSILDHYRKNSSLCVFVCRGLLRLLTLQQHHNRVKACCIQCFTKCRLKWHRHRTISVHFIYKNVLKFSVQRLSNEVQQIMHASLALLYPLLRLDISVLFYFFSILFYLFVVVFCRRWGVQKRKKGGWNRFTKE